MLLYIKLAVKKKINCSASFIFYLLSSAHSINKIIQEHLSKILYENNLKNEMPKKLPSKYIKAGNCLPTSKMPFDWHFAGGPKLARNCLLPEYQAGSEYLSEFSETLNQACFYANFLFCMRSFPAGDSNLRLFFSANASQTP